MGTDVCVCHGSMYDTMEKVPKVLANASLKKKKISFQCLKKQLFILCSHGVVGPSACKNLKREAKFSVARSWVPLSIPLHMANKPRISYAKLKNAHIKNGMDKTSLFVLVRNFGFVYQTVIVPMGFCGS